MPACDPNNQVVTFSPGTYNDAAALTTLMNGVSCPGHVFWFQPGAYYFNFTNGDVATNPTAHEWAINDGRHGSSAVNRTRSTPGTSSPARRPGSP